MSESNLTKIRREYGHCKLDIKVKKPNLNNFETKHCTAEKMKFCIKDFFSKCDQMLNGKLHFCAVLISSL